MLAPWNQNTCSKHQSLEFQTAQAHHDLCPRFDPIPPGTPYTEDNAKQSSINSTSGWNFFYSKGMSGELLNVETRPPFSYDFSL